MPPTPSKLADAGKKVSDAEATKTMGGAATKAVAKEAGTQSVSVYARLKPNDKGSDRAEVKVRTQKSDKGSNERVVSIKNLEFNLEWVFEEAEAQDRIYKTAGEERVNDVLGGKNATILAYGQTGSGKTHTMFGPQSVMDNFISCDPKEYGIVPRACMQIFAALGKESTGSRFARCTYIEVCAAAHAAFAALAARATRATRADPTALAERARGTHHDCLSLAILYSCLPVPTSPRCTTTG